MRTDFFVASLATTEGERLVILKPAEIPASFFFATSWDEKLRELALLTEEGLRIQLTEPEGEHFLVGPDEVQKAAGQAEVDPASWTGMSEPQLRQYLAKKGFSASDAEDAIQLFREWATIFTGSSVFPAPPKSN